MRFAVFVALFAAALFAQPSPQPSPQPSLETIAKWEAKMHAADAIDDEGDQLPVLREALKLADTFGESDPRLLETLIRLEFSCADDDDCDTEKEGFLDRALRIRKKVQLTEDQRYAALLMKLGQAASNHTERLKDALETYTEAQRLYEKLRGPKDQKVADALAQIARIHQSQKNDSAARRSIAQALALRDGSTDAPYADLVEASGRIYESAKDPQNAEKEFQRAISLRERLWPPSDPRFVTSLRVIAQKTSLKPFAERLYRRILDIQKTAHSARSEEYYNALFNLAAFLKGVRLEDAERTFETACALRDSIGRKDLGLALCLDQLADCRMEREHYQQAADAAESSIEVRARFEKPSEYGTLRAYSLLAESYLRARNEQKSDDAFARLSEAAIPNRRTFLVLTAEKLSKIYQDRGDFTHAAEKLETAIAIMEVQDPNDAQQADRMMRLSMIYQAAGRFDDANRMSLAAVRQIGKSVQNSGDPNLQKAFVIGAVVLGILPWIAIGVFSWAYWLVARRVDRHVARIFAPPKPDALPPPLPPPLPQPIVIESLVLDALPMPVPPPLPAEPPTPASAWQVSLQADTGTLVAIRVLNLLLSILTLGVYSFWGKAKVRRYVCGQAEFWGDRFAFHGTGAELLRGWLRALPALAFVFVVPNILPIAWQNKYALAWGQAAAVLAFGLLWPVARVGAYRYRLNRMSWRGVRFSYRGKAWRYLLWAIGGSLLSILTLGIYVPFLHNRLRRLLFDQTYFGSASFQYTGRPRDLIWAWIVAMPLCFFTLGIAWAWWTALRQRYFWAHTTFAGARFRCDATGDKIFWLWLGNILIIVPTLGFGASWAMLRTLRFWTRHIAIIGAPTLEGVHQDLQAASAAGESFADFLGFDFGF